MPFALTLRPAFTGRLSTDFEIALIAKSGSDFRAVASGFLATAIVRFPRPHFFFVVVYLYYKLAAYICPCLTSLRTEPLIPRNFFHAKATFFESNIGSRFGAQRSHAGKLRETSRSKCGARRKQNF